MSKYVRKKSDLDSDTPRTQLSKQLAKVCHQKPVTQRPCHPKNIFEIDFFCRQNWVFPFVQRLQTYQIEIRSKNSRLDHLQLLKVKIRIRHQVIQDVLRLLRIQFCHQFMNSKYHKFLYQPRYRPNFILVLRLLKQP